jgi:hypothetical protein
VRRWTAWNGLWAGLVGVNWGRFRVEPYRKPYFGPIDKFSLQDHQPCPATAHAARSIRLSMPVNSLPFYGSMMLQGGRSRTDGCSYPSASKVASAAAQATALTVVSTTTPKTWCTDI